MKLLLLYSVLLVVSLPAFAQQPGPLAGPEVTLHFGVYHGGSGRSIARQLEKDGFGEEGPGKGFFDFGIGQSNPKREEGSVQLGVLFPVRQTYSAKGLFLFRESEVKGHASFYEPVSLNTSVLTVAALGFAPLPYPNFRAGAGPAFHLARGTVLTGDTKQGKESFGKPGIALEGGYSTPSKNRFYADLQVQYLYAGKGDFGIHSAKANDFEVSGYTKKADFTRTSFSSFNFSLGVGFKLYKV